MKFPRWLQLLICFIFGFALGYYCGLKLILVEIVTTIDFSIPQDTWLSRLLAFSPLTNFLTIIATVNAAILAILIPLSHQLISEIRYRFQSEYIYQEISKTHVVSKKWWLNLPFLLIINILLAVFLIYISGDSPVNSAWLVTSLIEFILFIWIIVLTYKDVITFRKYLIYTDEVVEKIFNNASNVLSNDPSSEGQKSYIALLNAIGDILVFYIKIGRGSKVEEFLATFQELINYHIQQFSEKPEYLYSKEGNELLKSRADISGMLISMFPDDYIPTFSISINQLLRIHKVAIDEKHDTISSSSIKQLKKILDSLTKTENSHLVKYLLDSIFKANMLAISTNDSSKFDSTYGWYRDLVYKRKNASDNIFNLIHLDSFNEQLFRSASYLVNENEEDIFNELMTSIVYFPYTLQPMRPLSKYHKLFDDRKTGKIKKEFNELNITQRISELSKDFNLIDTNDKYQQWIKTFSQFSQDVTECIDSENINMALEIAEEIKYEATLKIMDIELLVTLYRIAIYCLFREKFHFILSMWEARHPTDADYGIIAKSLMPENLEELFNFYFSKADWSLDIYFHAGLHGNIIYIRQYFILLLFNQIKPLTKGEIDNLEFNNYSTEKLQLMINSLPELNDIFSEMIENKVMLDELNLSSVLQRNLIPKTQMLFENMQGKIKKILDDLQ